MEAAWESLCFRQCRNTIQESYRTVRGSSGSSARTNAEDHFVVSAALIVIFQRLTRARVAKRLRYFTRGHHRQLAPPSTLRSITSGYRAAVCLPPRARCKFMDDRSLTNLPAVPGLTARLLPPLEPVLGYARRGLSLVSRNARLMLPRD